MSTPRYLDALAGERTHARMLRNIIFAVAALGVVSTWFAWRTPKTIDVHLLPNVSAEAVVTVQSGQSPVPAQNVYAFAYYIWQQINRWQTDGADNYPAQVKAMSAYLTPRCEAQLTADVEQRNREGQLKGRSRIITEIPGLGYAPNRVVNDGGSWTVLLDTQVQEAFHGASVKDILIRYPIRVVRYDVDRERNPWQLALDCFGSSVPVRLSEADLRVRNPVTGQTEIKAPALPGQIAPATLPQAMPLQDAPVAPQAPSTSPAASDSSTEP